MKEIKNMVPLHFRMRKKLWFLEKNATQNQIARQYIVRIKVEIKILLCCNKNYEGQ